ncbi:hypothetical protein ASC66_04230 [Leifsonia sp. Root4]|nr:hypothetical protein ASC66_04230 [Leifsonia sp. Root4]
MLLASYSRAANDSPPDYGAHSDPADRCDALLHDEDGEQSGQDWLNESDGRRRTGANAAKSDAEEPETQEYGTDCQVQAEPLD